MFLSFVFLNKIPELNDSITLSSSLLFTLFAQSELNQELHYIRYLFFCPEKKLSSWASYVQHPHDPTTSGKRKKTDHVTEILL